MTSTNEPGGGAAGGGVTSLLTDRYELPALAATLADGVGDRPATFEVFTRRLPRGRRYGVVAGVDRVVDAVSRFRFDESALAYLDTAGVVDGMTLEWLADYRFRGTVQAYQDGELYFPLSPILVVEGTFAEAVVLETVILSILNHDCAVAAAASRMVVAAAGRPVIEMGSRRTHELAAVAAARAAHIAGFEATSNLECGRSDGVPTVGTSMHAFTLAHETEEEAFRSQLRYQGLGTTLLVDTYDIEQGIRCAVEVAREFGGDGPGAIRLDSGDLRVVVPAARAQLDALGATATRIVVTGDLDEHRIAELADLPVDTYGAGTSVVCGSGHPAAGLVYKLVAIAGDDGAVRHVAKASSGKASVGGRKSAYREFGDDGFASAERVVVCGDGAPEPAVQHRELLRTVIDGGAPATSWTLHEARAHHRRAVAELHPDHRRIADGPPAFEPQPA